MFLRIQMIIALLFVAFSPLQASTQTLDCADFDTWIWAQAVYDQSPEAHASLDPDGNGVACESLSIHGFAPAIWADAIPQNVVPATIERIADGDTLTVRLTDGTSDRVRLLHIDAPETSGAIGQCGGYESTEFLSWILSFASNGTIYLEGDVTERDRYDRRLSYVWFEVDGDPHPYMANYSMVLSGWAESETYKPDVKYKSQLDEAEQFSVNHVTGARLQCGKFGRPANDAGPSDEQIKLAWNNQPNQGQLPAYPGTGQAVEQSTSSFNSSSGTSNTSSTSVAAPVAAPAQSESCDLAYPDVCIPPYALVGDLDCGDISHRRFRVLPPDPHGFDGDADGVGCESG